MSRFVSSILIALLAALSCLCAHAAVDPALAKKLASDAFDDRLAAIEQLGTLPAEDARPLLQALADDTLAKADERLLIYDGETARDALSGETVDPVPEDIESISLNNRLRLALEGATASLQLFAPDRATRLAAAHALRGNPAEAMLPLFEKALASEQDPEIRGLLALAAARLNLAAEDPAKRLAAARALADARDPAVIALLQSRLEKTDGVPVEADAKVRAAIGAALGEIRGRLALADAVGTVFTGLSLGSILLLAALGLAITYGVMGVINMAHGELLMVGAYATYVVQGLFRQHLPAWVDWYVVAAIPASFACAALVGVVMERTVIRFLYGRPLESLLATWGLSLVLIQAARVSFGPQNLELANPAWMSGGVNLLGDVVLPWNRIVIVGFAVFVLLALWLLMQKTRLGLFVRAVTQNRAMAGCVGVPTARVDTLAFAIGAGVAGLGGCALSQIANVGPAMGQGYIVDAFMVVVVGGVGQLAGAVWAAFGLGLISKFLEGWTGAVIAKIVVLVFIIVFIQKRPQGLFALKGRFVES